MNQLYQTMSLYFLRAYEKICQGLLFAKKLETDTKGKSIFDVLEHYFKEKCIPLDNIVSVATEGCNGWTIPRVDFIFEKGGTKCSRRALCNSQWTFGCKNL
jgi:hypothetical protein